MAINQKQDAKAYINTQEYGEDNEGIQIDFGAIPERDIDVFHTYSFALDEDYLRLFTDKLVWKLNEPVITSIEISKVSCYGESDLTVCFASGDKKYGILIEDKIDAEAQPDQCARYYLRGDAGIENGDYDTYAVFICAPERYLKSDYEADKYENHLSFEEIEKYLSYREDEFSKLRLKEIRHILYTPRSKFLSIPDENATALWLDYIDFVHERFPDLNLYDGQRHKPKGGSWIEYKVPKGKGVVKLFHKTDKGILDLQFNGLGEKLDELSKIISNQIGDIENQGFVIEQAGKSAVLRRRCGMAIDYDKSFESQREIISEQVRWIQELTSIARDFDIEAIKSLYFDANQAT